jgi:formylglycine-generating enzyme required for sulfatase activity/serine/threonine protein kinase
MHDPFRLAGTVLEGRYRLDEVVGEGGFGVVYKGFHFGFRSPIAVKVLKVEDGLAPAVRDKLMASFDAEGALLFQLQKAHLAFVQVSEKGVVETPAGAVAPYLVMEWLDGESLAADLDRRGAAGEGGRPLAEALALLDPIAEALAVAHAWKDEAGDDKAVVHRDVKPANIMLAKTAQGRVAAKLLDFGIAKVMTATGTAAHRKTDTRRRVGFSIDYSAPEQWNSRRYGATGPWTDVYAFALVLVEVLSGKRALDVPEDAEELEYGTATTSDERPTPSSRGASVSPAVEAVFAKALALHPRDRYASARGFWGALREAAGATPAAPSAEPTPGPKRPLRTAFEVPEFEGAGAGGAVPTERAHPGELPTAPELARTAPARGARPLETSLDVPEFEGAGTAGANAEAQRPRAGSPSRALLAAGVLGGLAVVGALALAVKSASPTTSPALTAAPTSSAPEASASASTTPAAFVAPAPCPEGMILHPGGKFMMGTPEGKTSYPNERPVHEVTLSPFCLDRTEVTVAAYRACTKERREGVQCEAAPTKVDWKGIDAATVKLWSEACNGDRDDRNTHPVNCVDWAQADAYCRWAGKRLPTEAEWEYAGRCAPGGCAEPRTYPWGEEKPGPKLLNACDGDCVAWGKERGQTLTPMFAASDGWATTAPVGSYADGVSAFGVQDLAGNVWEWTADWKGPYSSEASRDPKGPGTGTARALRGGGWGNGDASNVRAAVRVGYAPSVRDRDVGFRCSRGPNG